MKEEIESNRLTAKKGFLYPSLNQTTNTIMIREQIYHYTLIYNTDPPTMKHTQPCKSINELCKHIKDVLTKGYSIISITKIPKS